MLTGVVLAALAASSFVVRGFGGNIRRNVRLVVDMRRATCLQQPRPTGRHVDGSRRDGLASPPSAETVGNPGAQQGRGRTLPGHRADLRPRRQPRRGDRQRLDRLIRDQIRVLNATFGGFEGGYATGFGFTLAGVTRTVNADWFYASTE